MKARAEGKGAKMKYDKLVVDQASTFNLFRNVHIESRPESDHKPLSFELSLTSSDAVILNNHTITNPMFTPCLYRWDNRKAFSFNDYFCSEYFKDLSILFL